MSTQITNGTSSIRIVIDGVVRFTFNKRLVVLEVDGTNLNLRHPSGSYLKTINFIDVTSPVTGNTEALRTAVKNFLIS